MYYKHKVVVKMCIHTLVDEVSPDDVKKTFADGDWDYDIEDTSLITPAEIVAAFKEDIRRTGIQRFRNYAGSQSDLIREVLDEVISRIEDFQTVYEEAL